MIVQQTAYNENPGRNIPISARQASDAVKSYERAFALQEIQLREARGQATVLLLQQEQFVRSPEAFRELFELREEAARRAASLSQRQHEVMDLVLEGHASKTIAWELGISQRTVENHRFLIMKKMGAKSLPALARLALLAACECAVDGIGDVDNEV